MNTEQDRKPDDTLPKGAATSFNTTIPHPNAKQALNGDTQKSNNDAVPKLRFPVRYQLICLRLLCCIPLVAMIKCLNVTLLVMVLQQTDDAHNNSTFFSEYKNSNTSFNSNRITLPSEENKQANYFHDLFVGNQTFNNTIHLYDQRRMNLSSPPDFGPQYAWTTLEQSLLLGAYFLGLLVMQLPGAALVARVGPRLLQVK